MQEVIDRGQAAGSKGAGTYGVDEVSRSFFFPTVKRLLLNFVRVFPSAATKMPEMKFLSQQLICRVVEAANVNRLVAVRALNQHHGRFDDAVTSLTLDGGRLSPNNCERRVILQSRAGGFLSTAVGPAAAVAAHSPSAQPQVHPPFSSSFVHRRRDLNPTGPRVAEQPEVDGSYPDHYQQHLMRLPRFVPEEEYAAPPPHLERDPLFSDTLEPPDSRQVDIVMAQTGAPREVAIQALRRNHNDLINAVMELVM